MVKSADLQQTIRIQPVKHFTVDAKILEQNPLDLLLAHHRRHGVQLVAERLFRGGDLKKICFLLLDPDPVGIGFLRYIAVCVLSECVAEFLGLSLGKSRRRINADGFRNQAVPGQGEGPRIAPAKQCPGAFGSVS